MSSKQPKPTTGEVLGDGSIIEMVRDKDGGRTALVRYANGHCTEEENIEHPGSADYMAVPAHNPIVQHGVVLFPERPEPYTDEKTLFREVRTFIHRYVDILETFEVVAAAYVLLSWVYDAFSELPYLRVRGDYGTGKTRFLLAVGSLAYKPIFGSGASTVSPLFHLLEQFGGTLVIDEADFRFSDDKADLVKILNNGNVRGFPVLRAVSQKNGEYVPRAFRVYGPKILATRGSYDDRALESRFFVEEMGTRVVRADIPLNRPKEFDEEAAGLRNKLLMYRFRCRNSFAATSVQINADMEPRLAQILTPLLCVVGDPTLCEMIVARVMDDEARRRGEYSESVEAVVLMIVVSLLESKPATGIAVGEIASVLRKREPEGWMSRLTDRRIGQIIRAKLGLRTEKRHGRFVVPVTENVKLQRLQKRYGIKADDIAAFTIAPPEKPA